MNNFSLGDPCCEINFGKTKSLKIAQSFCAKVFKDHVSQVSGLSNRNRHFCIENGMLTKLTAVGPDPMKLLKQIKYVGTHFNVWE